MGRYRHCGKVKFTIKIVVFSKDKEKNRLYTNKVKYIGIIGERMCEIRNNFSINEKNIKYIRI